QIGVVEIGRDLHGQRYTRAMLVGQALALLAQSAQQLLQLVVALQAAQVARVERGNVDRDITRALDQQRIHPTQALQVVVECTFDGRGRVLADVQAKNAAAR